MKIPVQNVVMILLGKALTSYCNTAQEMRKLDGRMSILCYLLISLSRLLVLSTNNRA